MLWFAHGSASYRKHFPPPPSPSKSAAATRASRRSKSAGIGCAPAFERVLDQRAPTWPICRGRQRPARQALQGQQADRLVTRIDPVMVSLVAQLRGHERQAAEELGQWKIARRGAQVPRRLTGGDHARHDLCYGGAWELEKKARNWRKSRPQLDRPSGAGARDRSGGGFFPMPHPPNPADRGSKLTPANRDLGVGHYGRR